MPDALHLQAAIFDMDGVITDTAGVHADSWKRLIDDFLRVLEEDEGRSFEAFDADRDYRRYVDGKPRYEGLRTFFEVRGIELPMGDPSDAPGRRTICGLANRKDDIFEEVLEARGVEVIEDTVALIRDLKAKGVRIAVASSSRNCERILRRAGLDQLFEERVDGNTLLETELAGKPDPEFFLEVARRMGVEPERSAVFEDATSGVEAGSGGGFGVVVGVAWSMADRIALREAGADLVMGVDELGGITPALLEAWVAGVEHRRPSALREWKAIARVFADARPAIFLDYDGTLTPIVDQPDRAVLPDRRRRILERLAERHPTTLVSGRSRADVFGFVGLENLNYAGSHGFDIAAISAEGEPLRHQVAEEVVPQVEAVTAELTEKLAGVEGALVEPKRFTVAVHYRLVSEDEKSAVEGAIDNALETHPALQKSHGKEVFEIRPRMDWDKGKAVLWLMEALALDGPDVTPLYIGDDTTDEDAFRALTGRGIGILVADLPRETAATYSLQDTEEVEVFLERLASI